MTHDLPDATATPAGEPGLRSLFDPRAVAIVGASGRPNNLFAKPLEYLVDHGFDGDVYPVNPNYDELRGLPCYPDLASLPGPVDLVLLLVPAAEVLRQLPLVAEAGASAAIVFASGFAETGDDGRDLQDEMVAIARAHGVRLVGPNCQGTLSMRRSMAATFTPALAEGMPRRGNVAYVGQSGAVGGSILSLARERGIGLSAWASTGNQADLTALEIGEHLLEEADVDVLTLYLESSVDGEVFTRVARRASELGTHLLVLQSGLSVAGRLAAISHTGAIIGSNAEFVATAERYGVVLAEDVEDFIACAHALSVLPRRGSGKRVAVVTTSGGAGSLAADQLEAAGMSVEPLAAETQRRLGELVPDFGAIANPVDVTAQLFRSGTTDAFTHVCQMVSEDDGVDGLMVILTMVTGEMAETMAAELDRMLRTARKPAVVVWLAAREQTVVGREILRRGGWPIVDSPRLGARMLDVLTTAPSPHVHEADAPLPEVRPVVEAIAGDTLTESGATELLALAAVEQPEQHLVTSAAEAGSAADKIDGALVMKVQSPEVLHKTERGGLRLGVRPTDAPDVYEELVDAFPEVHLDGVLVQEQAGDGPELIVGLTAAEPGYPPLLTVGIGGVTTELYGDAVTRLAPVSPDEARQMLLELRGAALLTGFRGSAGVELEPAAAAVSRLSRLAAALGERLVELEINPLRLCDGGRRPLALDFLLRLTPTSSSAVAVDAHDKDAS